MKTRAMMLFLVLLPIVVGGGYAMANRPISAGTANPDDRGTITAFFATPPDIPVPVAMAVTDEPEGGVPSPTGNRYLVGAAQ